MRSSYSCGGCYCLGSAGRGWPSSRSIGGSRNDARCQHRASFEMYHVRDSGSFFGSTRTVRINWIRGLDAPHTLIRGLTRARPSILSRRRVRAASSKATCEITEVVTEISRKYSNFYLLANDDGEAEGLEGRWQPRGRGRIEVWSGSPVTFCFCSHKGLNL